MYNVHHTHEQVVIPYHIISIASVDNYDSGNAGTARHPADTGQKPAASKQQQVAKPRSLFPPARGARNKISHLTVPTS